jgi:uncharacterized protein DUF3618
VAERTDEVRREILVTRRRVAADAEELARRVNVGARLRRTVRQKRPYLIGAAVAVVAAAVAIWRV